MRASTLNVMPLKVSGGPTLIIKAMSSFSVIKAKHL
jgi:hypothetical protein